MNTHILKHNETGLYVAKAGRGSSYTNNIKHAEKYNSKDEAINDSCIESEYPVLIAKEIE